MDINNVLSQIRAIDDAIAESFWIELQLFIERSVTTKIELTSKGFRIYIEGSIELMMFEQNNEVECCRRIHNPRISQIGTDTKLNDKKKAREIYDRVVDELLVS